MTTTQNAASQRNSTPDGVLDWLRAGNDRFARNECSKRDLLAQAKATSGDQFPLAAVLGCIDSRVPVEAVFDVGIGDVFAARSAGNVVDSDVIGGLEFATELAGAKVIVVLGHSACGAVKGACSGAVLGSLTQLLQKITPAVQAEAGGEVAPGADDADLVRRVVARNVINSIDTLRSSEVLAAREAAGDLIIVGGVYDLATGRIEWQRAPTISE